MFSLFQGVFSTSKSNRLKSNFLLWSRLPIPPPHFRRGAVPLPAGVPIDRLYTFSFKSRNFGSFSPRGIDDGGDGRFRFSGDIKSKKIGMMVYLCIFSLSPPLKQHTFGFFGSNNKGENVFHSSQAKAILQEPLSRTSPQRLGWYAQ